MKMRELQAIEKETIDLLRARSANGDNEAADVLLYHLRETSKAIEVWANNKNKKKENEPTS